MAVVRRRSFARDVILGLGAPILVTCVLSRLDEPARHRPGVVLVAVLVGVAGRRRRTTSPDDGQARSLPHIVWWASTEPHYEFAVRDGVDVLSVAVFAGAAFGVLLLLGKLEMIRVRDREVLTSELLPRP